jgi:hypothetical protein
MRVSKKVREEAALLCAIAASTDIFAMSAVRDLDLSRDAERLAYGAWARSFWETTHTRGECWCEDWAEAEALLRCGWSPE